MPSAPQPSEQQGRLTASAFAQACQGYLRAADQVRCESPSPSPWTYARGWQWRQHALIPSLSHLRRTFELPVRWPAQGTDSSRSCDGSEQNDVEDLRLIDSPGGVYEHIEEVETTQRCRDRPGTTPETLVNLKVTQVVLYSKTWRVPVLYLHVCPTDLSNGWTPTLSDTLASSLFHASAFEHGILNARTQAGIDGFAATSADADEDGDAHHQPSSAPGACERLAYFPPVTACESPLGDDGDPSPLAGATDTTPMPYPLGLWLYLHPCQTAAVVGEMMAAITPVTADGDGHGSHQQDGVQDHACASQQVNDAERYLHAFMAVCASAVVMRP
ncbi:unnamed protein product [Parajaminaea phylloscopi]